MYIPRGYLSTKQAVDRLHELWNWELLDGAPSRRAEIDNLYRQKSWSKPPPIRPIGDNTKQPPEYKPADFGLKEITRLRELTKIESGLTAAYRCAGNELRVALAEGEIQSRLLADTGYPFPIPLERWRANDGLMAVLTAQIKIFVPPFATSAHGTAVVKEDEFERWAEPQPTRAPDGAEVISWMLAHARNTLRETGAKPYRDSSIQACVQQTGCAVRIAGQAFAALPPDLKRTAAESRRTAAGKPKRGRSGDNRRTND